MCNFQIIEEFQLSMYGKKSELRCTKHFPFHVLSSLMVFFYGVFFHFNMQIFFICRMTVKIAKLFRQSAFPINANCLLI